MVKRITSASSLKVEVWSTRIAGTTIIERNPK